MRVPLPALALAVCAAAGAALAQSKPDALGVPAPGLGPGPQARPPAPGYGPGPQARPPAPGYGPGPQAAPPAPGYGPGPQANLPTQKPPPLAANAPQPQRPSVPQPWPPQRRQEAALPSTKPPPLGRGEAPERRQVSSGTGFVVGPRQLLTNHHVADGCGQMVARLHNGQEIPATVLASDRRRDLALLRTDADAGPPLAFRRATEVRRGEDVVTYGFPLAGLLSSGPTLTTGGVSALAGLADNPRQIQISAPVQPGNSGGPLLDLRGQVVGVVVSKLNAQRIAERTGDIPQNVNFAVKHTEALDFLRENGVQPVLGESGAPARTAAEVGETAHVSTVFLRCMR